MKILTDENISTFTVSFLRRLGHDVKDIKEEGLYGIDDIAVFALAQKEERILVTIDKDFGKIVYQPPKKHAGIILLRITPTIDIKINFRLATLFESYPPDEIKHKFVVISNKTIRVR